MKSDLISVLKKLSPEELKKLGLLLASPYFYVNKNTFLLFEELQKYYPLFNIPEEDKFKIYKSIYGEIPYNDSTFRNLMHQLLCAVEQFILLQYFREHDLEKNLVLLEEFTERDIDELFSKKARKLDKGLSSREALFVSENLMYRFKFTNLILNSSISNQRILHKNTIEFQFENVNRSIDYLALYFYIESICDYVIKKIYQKTYNLENSNYLTADFITIESNDLKKKFCNNKQLIQIIDLYSSLLKTYQEFDDLQNYYKYRNQIRQSKNIVTKSGLTEHYKNLISYCIIKKNGSKDSEYYKKELWQLYGELLNDDLVIVDKNPYLDLNLFRSILFLGLSLHLFDEVERFINKYSLKVNPREVINASNLAYAYLYYEQREYEKALGTAIEIAENDFILKYDIKNLLIKIYYELNYIESLDSAIDSYRKYMKYDIILNKDLKIQFQNFLNYTEKLFKCPDNSSELEFQMNELTKNPSVYAKDWLLEKYSDLLQLKVCMA